MQAPQVFSEATGALCFVCVLLIPCALAGLAIIAAGLGRSRNVAHSLLSTLCVIGVAAITYFAVGSAWEGYPGGPAATLRLGGRAWDWIGTDRFLLRGVDAGGPYLLAVMFGLFTAALAAAIPLGAAAERWRLGACCASTAVFAGFTYPLFAHWVWGGGWLAQLGANFHLGMGFIDSGGGATVQACGGLTALAISWILGPRRGKFHPKGLPAALPAHNAAFVLFGCFLAWVGYLGLDCAGAILFAGAVVSRAGLVPVNVTLAASAALLSAAGVTRARFHIVDASICANAWVAGLVAASAGCAVVRPAGAVLIGLIAGSAIVFSVEWFELRKIDDPAGAISVHAIGGIWGVLAVGLLAPGSPDQWLAQLVGIATLIGFVLPVAYASNWLLNRVLPQRAAPEAERRGLDLYELGAGAYPDFMTHNEDF
jgi:Amt family ammonium transporter